VAVSACLTYTSAWLAAIWGPEPRQPAATDAFWATGVFCGQRSFTWGNRDGGRGTANGCGLNLGARWIEDSESPDGSGRTNKLHCKLADVFSCLATAVGVGGSFLPTTIASAAHGTQSLVGINEANRDFLREEPTSPLLSFPTRMTVSADPNITVNDGIFLQNNPGDNRPSEMRSARPYLQRPVNS